MLLPNQPASPSRRDAALTARFLTPARASLMEWLLSIRAEVDRDLGPSLDGRYGKPYPYGCCQEITLDVMRRITGSVARSEAPGARALLAYLKAGGACRRIWGVLRGVYFQNALQCGGLYIDVSNDTVTVTKPKVEIADIAECGLERVTGIAHFNQVATGYWGFAMYPNHAVPSLAPVLPVMSITPAGGVSLQSATDYMVALLRLDDFRQSESWIVDGPAPPAKAIEALRALCPPDLLAANPEPTAAAAVAACRTARAIRPEDRAAWCLDRVLDFQRMAEMMPKAA